MHDLFLMWRNTLCEQLIRQFWLAYSTMDDDLNMTSVINDLEWGSTIKDAKPQCKEDHREKGRQHRNND